MSDPNNVVDNSSTLSVLNGGGVKVDVPKRTPCLSTWVYSLQSTGISRPWDRKMGALDN
jgi:hypothetical protein